MGIELDGCEWRMAFGGEEKNPLKCKVRISDRMVLR